MQRIKITRKISIKGIFIQSAMLLITFLSVLVIYKELSPHKHLNKYQFRHVSVIVYVIYVSIYMLQHYRHLKRFKQGVRLMRLNQYEAAIQLFEQTYKYYEAHPLKDKYRYALLISTSVMPIRQMCVTNITACYVFLKNKDKATFYYKTMVALNRSKEIHLSWYDDFVNKNLL